MSFKTAIFIEPQGPLRDEIVQRKALLEKQLPHQTYTTHPPHSTLIFGSYGDPAKWLPLLRDRLSDQRAFPLHVRGWIEFLGDAMANGGHTVAYRAQASADLLALQLAVAETIAPFHCGDVSMHPLAGTEPFATSLRKYGGPFIGAHWIPHFTIGAPKCDAGDPLLAQLKEGDPDFTFPVSAISIWKVLGDNHERLHDIPFEGSL